jgi:hypothetical protein
MVDTVSRTVRFKLGDLDLIDEFLDKNPLFDFSTLTRVALLEFIKNPTLEIRPVETKIKHGQHAAPVGN